MFYSFNFYRWRGWTPMMMMMMIVVVVVFYSSRLFFSTNLSFSVYYICMHNIYYTIFLLLRKNRLRVFYYKFIFVQVRRALGSKMTARERKRRSGVRGRLLLFFSFETSIIFFSNGSWYMYKKTFHRNCI
jgi:hypothetical protein